MHPAVHKEKPQQSVFLSAVDDDNEKDYGNGNYSG
jgi:hypothetical protein